MGTRNLTCVFHDGKYKLAQYGQWDGYPSGQGATALAFLRGEYFDRARLIAQLDAAYAPTEAQYNDWYIAAGADPKRLAEGYVDYDASKRFSAKHPNLSRDTGAKILQLMATSTGPIALNVRPQFAADSLFCEWCYVIDLDKNTFEVFRGFNKEPLEPGERFYGATCDDAAPGYHPVKLVRFWSLDDLPDEASFLKALEDRNDDEDEAA